MGKKPKEKEEKVFSVALDGPLKDRISAFQVKGQGGFQGLMKMLKEKLREQELSLPLSRWVCLWNYTQRYGVGGYQSVFRHLVRIFESQHPAIDLSKAEGGKPRKNRTQKPRQLSLNEAEADRDKNLDLPTEKK